MVRVETSHARQASAGPASQRHHQQLTNSTKANYKIILEEVTQHKKTLITVVGLFPAIHSYPVP